MADFEFGDSGSIGTVLIAGPPACGKSTQCGMLLEKYGLLHVSAGDILRARRKYLPELASYMDQGLLVPDDLVCAIIKERLMQKDCKDKGVLLDGFPRTRKQAEVLAQMGIEISHMVLLEVPDEVLIGRVEGRRIDPVSGEVYNIDLNAPTDPEILARLVTRTDDTRDKMVQRLKMYHQNKESIVRFYGEIVQPVDANKHPEQVFDSIRDVLEGELYWGCTISREWPVRAYECSSEFDVGSNDIITTTRYVDHLTWLMLGRGVLADVRHPISFKDATPSFQESKVSFVVRAHSVEMHQVLLPGLRLHLNLWLHEVGNKSVTLRFDIFTTRQHVEKTIRLLAITGQRSPYLSAAQAMLKSVNQRILVATGASVLVSLDRRTGQSTLVPQRKRLKNLVVKRGDTHSEPPAWSVGDAIIQKAFSSSSAQLQPPDAHKVEIMVRPMDLGLDGFLNPSTLVAFVEGARTLSSRHKFNVHSIWFENLERVNVNQTLTIIAWRVNPTRELWPLHNQFIFLCFDVLVGARKVMRGMELLQPVSTKSSL